VSQKYNENKLASIEAKHDQTVLEPQRKLAGGFVTNRERAASAEPESELEHRLPV
jgi:hypothetical protein